MVIGSPNTLSSDGVWRSWIRWVRDNGAFSTANSLPLCDWENPAEAFLADVDITGLAPIPKTSYDDEDEDDAEAAAASAAGIGVLDRSWGSEDAWKGGAEMEAALQGAAEILTQASDQQPHQQELYQPFQTAEQTAHASVQKQPDTDVQH